MFDRLQLILEKDKLNKIQKQKILIVGIGGVGANALESLVRFGIQEITIIDHDTIDITNLNRQLITLHSNIGNYKVNEAKKRMLDINPNLKLKCIKDFLTKSNINNLLNKDYNYIIDACDTVTTKLELMRYCETNNIKLITCLGTGNRFDPTKLKITTLDKTNGDPLAKILRKLVQENHINKKQNVIWSEELPIKTNNRTPGSTSLVPNVAGIYCASFVINDIIKSK